MVHQSSELYGSDRSFLSSVAALKESNKNYYVKVLLPCDGPLVKLLMDLCDEVEIVDFGVLRKANIKKKPFSELVSYLKSVRYGLIEFKKFDLIYLNTIVLVPFIFSSRWNNKTIIHVRDIAPGFLKNIFKFLLSFSKSKLIFNSNYLKDYFQLSGTVIHNGVAPSNNKNTRNLINYRRALNIVFIGRINGWKGLDHLLIALAGIDEGIIDSLAIYGDCFEGQEVYLEQAIELSKKVHNVKISFMGFKANAVDYLREFDLIVVPSKEPEPFGRVVIEAMAAGTPPLIAGHGGMCELVTDNETGFVFLPNDIFSLRTKLIEIFEKSESLNEISKNCLKHFEAEFSEEKYKFKIEENISSFGKKHV